MKNLLIIFLTFSGIIALMTYCNSYSPTSNEENWQYLGRQIVGIDSVAAILNYNNVTLVTDIIRSTDTLSLRVYGHQINGDRFDNDSLHAELKAYGIYLLLSADIYNYIGSGIMPPTSLRPTVTLDIPPPFIPGYYIASLCQPDCTIKYDTLVVSQ